jgi:hypothetical protein
MTERIEDDLRAALAQRAATIPADAGARMRNRDYRPRGRSMRPPVAAGGLVAAGSVAAIAAVTLGTSTPRAFAGWQATPTAASADQVSTAEANCRAQLAALPAPPAGVRGPLPSSTSGCRPAPFTFVILADANDSASCITGPSFRSESFNGSSRPIVVDAGQVALSRFSVGGNGNGAYSFGEGHTGSGVTGVALTLTDGTRVQATVQGGWFVAWWPGASTVAGLLVTTASGTHTQSVPSGACPSGPAGGSVSCTQTIDRRRHGQSFGEMSAGGSGSASGSANGSASGSASSEGTATTSSG